jgi:hypothetical protein
MLGSAVDETVSILLSPELFELHLRRVEERPDADCYEDNLNAMKMLSFPSFLLPSVNSVSLGSVGALRLGLIISRI